MRQIKELPREHLTLLIVGICLSFWAVVLIATGTV